MPRRAGSRHSAHDRIGHHELIDRLLTDYSEQMVYTFRHFGSAQMLWKECKPMDESVKFIDRRLESENKAAICRESGISRGTGIKIFNP